MELVDFCFLFIEVYIACSDTKFVLCLLIRDWCFFFRNTSSDSADNLYHYHNNNNDDNNHAETDDDRFQSK